MGCIPHEFPWHSTTAAWEMYQPVSLVRPMRKIVGALRERESQVLPRPTLEIFLDEDWPQHAHIPACRRAQVWHAESCWIMLRGKPLIMETLTIKVGNSRHVRRIHRQLLFVLKDIGGFHGKVCPWWGLSRTFRRERLMEPLRQDSHLHAMFFRLGRTRHDKTNAVVISSSEPLQWLPFCISACRHVL